MIGHNGLYHIKGTNTYLQPRVGERELEDPEKSEEVIGIEMESWVVEELLLDLSSSNSVHERVDESLDLGHSSKKCLRGCCSIFTLTGWSCTAPKLLVKKECCCFVAASVGKLDWELNGLTFEGIKERHPLSTDELSIDWESIPRPLDDPETSVEKNTCSSMSPFIYLYSLLGIE